MSHSSRPELPGHWRFALGQAISGIERLVRAFDFEAPAGKHAYATAPAPGELIEIIDGFLSEPNLLGGGDITNLKRLRDMVGGQITEAYRAGQVAASAEWDAASPEARAGLVERSAEEVRESARGLGPAEACVANWFVQGYCRRWAEESFEQMAREAKEGLEHRQ